ncbi:MAG: hypothetical protein M5U05_13160 [Anaerolineales bacterium]|nr:hypothetical protein [Anaerolineales bacterium]
MFYVYILHSGGRRRSTARLLSDYSRTGAFCQVMNVILCAAGAGRRRVVRRGAALCGSGLQV